jgi:hypothetical protein
VSELAAMMAVREHLMARVQFRKQRREAATAPIKVIAPTPAPAPVKKAPKAKATPRGVRPDGWLIQSEMIKRLPFEDGMSVVELMDEFKAEEKQIRENLQSLMRAGFVRSYRWSKIAFYVRAR